jgi:hypothetical protein
MTSEEYNAARLELELTGVDFARLVGASWRNGQRYMAGGAIPEPVARLVRTIINNKLRADQVG